MRTSRCPECSFESLGRVYSDRDETDTCEAGTPGCCIDHTAETRIYREQLSCESW